MKLTKETAYSDDLTSTDWLGEVIDINDPLKIGRVKIRVWGKFDELDPSFIPWANPISNFMSGSSSGGSTFSVPKLNSIVGVIFDNGDIYHPQYHYNQRLSDDVKEEIKDSYENAQVIVYDTVTQGHLKIFFTEKKGLVLSYKGNDITIKPDDSIDVVAKSDITLTTDKNVNVNAKEVIIGATDKIELGSSASQSILLGDNFCTLFDNHIHLTPNGPTQKPVITSKMKTVKSKLSYTK